MVTEDYYFPDDFLVDSRVEKLLAWAGD